MIGERGTSWLADHCPRLHRAHHAERARRARRDSAVLRARRCEAHRELQLIRAAATGNGTYIAERQRKLREIRAKIERLEASS